MRSLHVYPIKSCRGLEIEAASLDVYGLHLDRRFMVAEETGRFLTQRQEPRMALIRPTPSPSALVIRAPGMSPIEVPLRNRASRRVPIQVWNHRGEAEDAGEAAAKWFSEYLGRRCRLVTWADDQVRLCDPQYARFESQVAFPDSFPVLLVSEASLDDLNTRMEVSISMDRFRPNIVVDRCEPYAEDSWEQISIGDVKFDVVKPCERCTTITVDQMTGEISKEPLKVLATYRKRGNAVLFGENCIHHGPGMVRVGDEVVVTA